MLGLGAGYAAFCVALEPRHVRVALAAWAFLNGAAGLAVAFSFGDARAARLLGWAAVGSASLSLALLVPFVPAAAAPGVAAYGLGAGGLQLAAARRVRTLSHDGPSGDPPAPPRR